MATRKSTKAAPAEAVQRPAGPALPVNSLLVIDERWGLDLPGSLARIGELSRFAREVCSANHQPLAQDVVLFGLEHVHRAIEEAVDACRELAHRARKGVAA